MLTKWAIRSPPRITAIQAPPTNFVTPTISITSPVVAAPSPLTVTRHRHPAGRRLIQRRTMLDWDKVNEVKTPTAYNGISAWVIPSNTAMSVAEATPRMMTPV
jgi:hypothetical protein